MDKIEGIQNNRIRKFDSCKRAVVNLLLMGFLVASIVGAELLIVSTLVKPLLAFAIFGALYSLLVIAMVTRYEKSKKYRQDITEDELKKEIERTKELRKESETTENILLIAMIVLAFVIIVPRVGIEVTNLRIAMFIGIGLIIKFMLNMLISLVCD